MYSKHNNVRQTINLQIKQIQRVAGGFFCLVGYAEDLQQRLAWRQLKLQVSDERIHLLTTAGTTPTLRRRETKNASACADEINQTQIMPYHY